jgi:hypothetical protein
MNLSDELDPGLKKKLNSFMNTSPKEIDLAVGRAAFLAEVQQLAGFVTHHEEQRHIRWIEKLQTMFFIRKERSTMPGILTTLILITALVFGGGGATIVAARSSLPDQPLYSVKTLTEDIRLALATDPQAAYQLALDFADLRADEIESLVVEGKNPPENVANRYQEEVETSLKLASGLPAEQAAPALEQVIQRLQTQQQTLQQVGLQASPQGRATLLRSQEMIMEQLLLAQAGLRDTNLIQQLEQDRDQIRLQTDVPLLSGTQDGIPSNNSGNPWVEGTPTPGSGYGPGDGTGDCLTCTPQGSGSNNNDQGGSPWTTGTPVPGSGYGPGPGPDASLTCTPGSSYGPAAQPEDTSPQGGTGQQSGDQSPQGGTGQQGGPGGKK